MQQYSVNYFFFWLHLIACGDFASGSVVKNPPAKAGYTGDLSSIPGSGRSPGEGNGNSLQHSCLENPRDRGASWAAAQGAAKSRTQLITHALNCHCLWDLFPNQESNPSPWQWKHRVLTIGPPRNSPTLKKNWLLN